ncbi:MAG: glycosyltransferase family 4 protein, partial [Candidatus Margulisbacteria bacterium]|nr:glycosyltransferase family 4 protein [Candidatus Margulisiibacteriota bacterium]MBU1617361.1 glycosyltransferase family 4 protein [Candidatus Margulisiibacteriota bacterium]
MRIAFNKYFIGRQKTGIGHYSSDLLAGLKKTSLEIKEINNPCGLNKLLFEQIYLPIKLVFSRVELYFSTSIVLPYFLPCRSIIVVYDLVFKLFPEYYRGGINLAYLGAFFPPSLKRAKRIVAISQSTKNDLIRLYGVAPDKIKVIYPAVGGQYQPITDQARLSEVRKRYSLPEKFIFNVGTIEPRKNTVRLVEAYRALPPDLRAAYPLVLCGKKGWGKSFAEELSGIILLDYVGEADLPLIYNLAALFVYPSMYEGFGLPILEAMSCGIPVITSNISSMPEVAGEAAILIDPQKTGQLTEAMSRIMNDPEMARELSRKGLEQAKKFSWEKAAAETLAVIE